MRKEIEILRDIEYETRDGTHTFTMCKCGRQGCRGLKCTECLREELYDKYKKLREGTETFSKTK